MLDIFSKYETDESAEANGVEVPLGTAKLLIARVGNPNYTKKLTGLVERHKVALDIEGPEADALNEKLLVETIADTILLGWSGVCDREGKEFPYSKDNARKALTMKDFRQDVMKLASDMEAYKVKAEAEAGKP